MNNMAMVMMRRKKKMTDKELKQIQRQGHFDLGRLLTESELRELAYLHTGSSCFTWGDILSYVSNNALEFSVDFIKEVQTNYAKEYVAEHHSNKVSGMRAARKCTQVCLISIIRTTLLKSTWKKQFELIRKLQREGYFKFFE